MSVNLLNRYCVRSNVYVETNDVNFLKQIESDLTLLESKEVGKRLMTRISKGKHFVFISEGAVMKTFFLDAVASRMRGKGCSSQIMHSLDKQELVDSRGKPHVVPPFIGLVHELIHAYHAIYGKNARGEYLSDYSKIWWSHREEIHTIRGFPSKNPHRTKPKISENAIRQEHGYPERFGHISAPDDSKKKSSLKSEARFQYASDLFYKKIKNPYSSPPVVQVFKG